MVAIREALERQQRSIQKLCAELDGERNASSTATNEAMLMILAARDYLLYKRDEAHQSLYSELHAYQRRLLSYPEIPDAAAPRFVNLPVYDYPKLRCKVSLDLDPDGDDDEYTFGDEEEFQSYFSVWNGGQEFNKGDEYPVTVDGRPLDDGGSNDDSSDSSMQCTVFRGFGGATATRAQQGRRGKGEWMEGRRKR